MEQKEKRRKRPKVNKIKKLLFLLVFFIILSTFSVVYASYMQKMENITVSKIFDQEEEKVIIKSVTNIYGYDIFDVEYTNDSISVNVELPNLESSNLYEIEIENKTENSMQLIDINAQFENENFIFEIYGFQKDYYILAGETITMMIEIKYSSEVSKLPENLEYNNIFEFTWEELEQTDLVARITYSEVNWTKNNVSAKLEFNQKDIEIINNEKNSVYIFEENGEFTFEYLDSSSTVNTVTAKVSWIDKDMEVEDER